MAFEGLGLDINASVTKAVNSATSKFSADSIKNCVTDSKNILRTVIDNSKLNITGDFEVSQDAQIVFSCVQKSDKQAELTQSLLADIKKEVSKAIEPAIVSVGQVGVNVSESDITNIVNSSVSLDDAQKCIATISNTATLDIKDSLVNVGVCEENTLKANAAACADAYKLASAMSVRQEPGAVELVKGNVNCKAVAQCAEKAGKFLIDQGIKFTGECDQASAIALKVTQAATTLLQEKYSLKKTNPFTSMWMYFIIGGVVLIGLILAVYLLTRKRKGQAEMGQQYSDPMMYGQQQQQPMMMSEQQYGGQQYGPQQYGGPQSPSQQFSGGPMAMPPQGYF